MRQKLKKLIDAGGDIEFSVGGAMYTILPWADGGILIGPQGADEDEVFKTADDLINGYCINGYPLSTLLNQITITFSS